MLEDAQMNLTRYQTLEQQKSIAAQQAEDQVYVVQQGKGTVLLDQANVETATINLGYTRVLAPFDGVVTNHQVDLRALVGMSGPTTLATIVQLDPLYVYFTTSEPQILAIRRGLAKRGESLRTTNLSDIPVEIGLQDEEGYPHKGHMDYVSPQVDTSTGTLTGRALFDNKDQVHYCRACSCGFGSRSLVRTRGCSRETMRSGRAKKAAMYWLSGGTMSFSANRQNRTKAGSAADHESGLDPGDWVVTEGVQRAFPGAKVEPQRSEPTSIAADPSDAAKTSVPGRHRNETSLAAGMISRFFIDRPVLANVLALVFVLIGLVSLLQLPTAQYPNVVPPTIQVKTLYPGASAKTLIDTVALPIEQSVNGVEDMLYMQSTSADDGSYNLVVTFAIGTDPDKAQILVQNQVAAATASLPQQVQAQGVTTAKKSTSILEIVTLVSPDSRFDRLFLSNYAVINVQNELARLKGIGDVTILGAAQYAMRIWMDPDLLQSRALTPQDVINAIQQQSQEVAAGQVGAPPAPSGQDFQYTLNLKGRLDDVAEFENIVVKVDAANGGQITRIRDIGRAELGAQTYSTSFNLDGRPAAGIQISLLPDANAIAVADKVHAKMEELAKSFPAGLTYVTPFDTTKFVKAAINEVYLTLIEAGVLVLIVILVFLQDWRAMLVPATTVPVTIIGAFAAMAALGFSVNLSTLFAIVLAIGIVVDDAIVIVEGVSRYVEQGVPGREAAGRAMDDLMGPVIGITLVLMSVFVPAAFLPGLTGQIFRQFALVIAATAFISAINAVTLKPTQSALWLRPPTPGARRNLFSRGFNAVFRHHRAGLCGARRRNDTP